MEDRDALFYPYIHIKQRDVEWLKATLLTFPHVVRMVPRNFHLYNDAPAAREFAELEGRRNEPLLGRIDLLTPSVRSAQRQFDKRLLEDVEQGGKKFLARYSRDAAKKRYKDGVNAFQIHRDKISGRFLDSLTDLKLAWSPTKPNRGAKWVGVHPLLGEAVMSTIAATLAEQGGYDVVTSSGDVHAALADRDAEGIYDAFIKGAPAKPKSKKPGVINEVVQFVIMTHFNIGSLGPQDIAALSRDREGLFALKDAVEHIAGRVPPMTDRVRREKYLREAAESVISRWQEDRMNMTKFARELFGSGMLKNAENFLKKIATSVVGGSAIGAAAASSAAPASGAAASAALIGGLSGPILLGAGAGLAVGVFFHGVSTGARQYTSAKNSPYRYLSRLRKAGAALVLNAPATVKRE